MNGERPNRVDALARMSQSEFENVLGTARALKSAAESGAPRLLLRGKHLGLLSETQDSAEAATFRNAAHELGARVALIRPSLSKLATLQEIRETAHLLARLYDAVECQGMPQELVELLGREAGVPVYDSLTDRARPNDRVVELLGELGAAAGWHYLLQALLLNALTER
jgi:ornithine carbamoyltransferase